MEVISITEDTGDSVFGSLIERIIEWMDEFYSIRLGEEVRAKMTYVAGKGVVQTTPPFGYTKQPGEPMQIVPDEARWVQYAADQFLQGKGILTIASELNARGVRTHRGNLFENRTIEYMLHNPIYAGFTRWTPTGPTVGRRIYDSPDTIVARGDFDPIYPEETYRAILAEFERRERLRPKYARPDHIKKHWLSGFLKCGACGASMVFAARNNGFQCQKYAHGLCNVSHFITAPKIETAVLDELCRMKITKKIIRASLRPVGNVIDNSAEIMRLSHMLDRAKFAYMQGVDTLEDYSRVKKKIDAEIAVLRDEEERSKVLPPEPTVPEVEGRIAYLAALLQRPATTDDERRDALGEIVEKITFSRPGNVVRIFLRL